MEPSAGRGPAIVPAYIPDRGLKSYVKPIFALYMRVALSRPCPGAPFRPFQAAPIWTPAAICQDTGFPGCSPRRPGAALMSLFLFAKFGILSLTTKKNLKKYLISLIIKHLQRGIFSVKRFNSRAVHLVALPVLRWRWLPVHPPTRAHVCTYARRHGRNLLKRFVLGFRHPGGIFVLLRTRYAKIKRFNRLCYVSCM